MTTSTLPPSDADWLATQDQGLTQQPDGGPRRRRGYAAPLALVLAGALAGGVATQAALEANATNAVTATSAPGALSGLGRVQPAQPEAGNAGGAAAAPAPAPVSADAYAAAARRVSPALVDINTTLGYAGAQAAGTGMVVTSSGEILTNNHVISGATSISVTDVGNGQTYNATVVGYDRSRDVAVLQLQGASGLATITTASQPVQVGDPVVGVGNAGGTGGAPTYAGGVITARGQTITATDASDGTSEQLTGLLETNADIVAGDSGGALVNDTGQVVGMDTAASAGYSFGQASQGYAIPIGEALTIAEQIEAGQASSTVHIGATPMLGVAVATVNRAAYAGGATVAQVLPGGPAAAAGLSAGDTILAVEGRNVASAADLSRLLLQSSPGATVAVRYRTPDGQEVDTSVRLVEGPPQ